jgi:hypothetical protein
MTRGPFRLDGKESGQAALRAMGVARFVPTSHEDFAELYDMAREAGYSFRKK